MKALVALVLAGCGFDAQTGHHSTSGLCPFEVEPDYTDPCTSPAPEDFDDLPDVTITDANAIDTGNGEIVGPNVFKSPPTSVDGGVRIVWTKTFTIAMGGSLHAYGDLPLMIVATNAIRIEGRLDASSTLLSNGPGANPAACTALAAGPGLTCANQGASGGGGGGFGAAGGDGGKGGDTHACTGTTGKPGGIGGKALGARPPELRGGCPGGDGALSDNNGSTIGLHGPGGGAVALVARDKILVSASGTIHVGGAGGQPGLNRAGGGGGGSGGMIFLEAVDIDLQPSSVLAANGGGGAGGTDNSPAEAGEDAWPSLDNADGGTPDSNGGRGGDGGIIMFEQGLPGATADRGAGGGGGGVGVIRLHEKTSSRSGTVTPAIAQ